MRRSQPKSHTISEGGSTWTMAIPAFFVFVVVVSIVLLGVMGETDAMDSAHAGESTAPVESHPPAEPDMLVRGKR